jgi:hypothetical protein
MTDIELLQRQSGAQAARRSPRKAALKLPERLERAGDRSLPEMARTAAAAWAEGALETLRAQHRCQRCGRRLTDETSIERGIGTECARGSR